MSDLTQTFLTELMQGRIDGLGLPDPVVYPAYHGQSIVNIPSGICHWMSIPSLGAPPLDRRILEAFKGPFKRVMVILMDALALHRLQRWMRDGTAPVWSRLADNGLMTAITSITPSTTSAALTAYWTGRTAAEHGITGYEMWMREYGIVANTILHSPMSFTTGSAGSLENAGFDPPNYLPFLTLGQHLKAYGVQTHALQHYTIAHSGLSRMLYRDVAVHTFSTAADLWIDARKLFERQANERLYTWVYWSEVDHLGHFYNPDDEHTAAEFALFSHAFENLFLERLPDQLRDDTLVILSADHGQIFTPKNPQYELRNHPDLARRLVMAPTGENRLAYLYVKPGQTEAVREIIEHTWPDQFSVLDSAAAIEAGLFGPGERHPMFEERVGDLMMVARDDAYLWWAEKDNPLAGRHGGMDPQEMLVPLIVARPR